MQILPIAQTGGESAVICNLLICLMFYRSMHGFTLDFRPGTTLEYSSSDFTAEDAKHAEKSFLSDLCKLRGSL